MTRFKEMMTRFKEMVTRFKEKMTRFIVYRPILTLIVVAEIYLIYSGLGGAGSLKSEPEYKVISDTDHTVVESSLEKWAREDYELLQISTCCTHEKAITYTIVLKKKSNW